MNLVTFLQTFIATRREDDKGAAMVEYGILVAGIAVLVMAVVFVLGGAITASSRTSSTSWVDKRWDRRERASDDARSRRPRPSCRGSEELDDVQIQA